ncbi:MAG: CDP-alcohol phosphatidyltransferase family protein [Candidatus Geothermarchaeota archaeon]
MLNKFRETINSRVTNKIVAYLSDLGFQPWMLTTLSITIFIISSILLVELPYKNAIAMLSIAFLIAGFLDALDGALARHQNKTSKLGDFYDSLVDRVTEIVLIFALLATNLIHPNIAYIYISTALLISYIRAKGDYLGFSLQGIGLMERAERLIAVVLSLLLWATVGVDLNVSFSVITVANVLTIIQRISHLVRLILTWSG